MGKTQPGHLPALEGARGLAIVLVFLIHLHEFLLPWLSNAPVTTEVVRFFYTVGNLAGDFFLVVSGCCIYRRLIAKPVPYWEFLRGRMTRIYSVFLCVLSLYLVLSILFPGASKLPSEPVHAVLYVLANIALLPGLLPITPIISVSWTLSFIGLCYVGMPLLIAGLGMREWSPSQRAWLFAALLCVGSAAACCIPVIPLRLNMLTVGVLVAEAQAKLIGTPASYWRGKILIAVMGICIVARYFTILVQHLPAQACCRTAGQTALAAVAMFCCALWVVSTNSRFLQWTPLRSMGQISFSYYLSHSLAIKLFSIAAIPLIAAAAQSGFGFWAVQPLLFLISLPPAILLFALVERRNISPYSRTARETPYRLSTAGPQPASSYSAHRS